jgi:hypothetical protein
METLPLELFFWILIVLSGLFVYLLPAIVALWTKHPRAWTITLLTVLLGWTGIGWFALLFWSLNDEYVLKGVTVGKESRG